MAALYGRLHGQAGEVTRIGSKASGITAKLETWNGSVQVNLEADGRFEVFIGSKHSPALRVVSGNVDTREANGHDLTGEHPGHAETATRLTPVA